MVPYMRESKPASVVKTLRERPRKQSKTKKGKRGRPRRHQRRAQNPGLARKGGPAPPAARIPGRKKKAAPPGPTKGREGQRRHRGGGPEPATKTDPITRARGPIRETKLSTMVPYKKRTGAIEEATTRPGPPPADVQMCPTTPHNQLNR